MNVFLPLICLFILLGCGSVEESKESTRNQEQSKSLADSVRFHILKADSSLKLSTDINLDNKIFEAMKLLDSGENVLFDIDTFNKSIAWDKEIQDSIMSLENVNNDSLYLDYLIKTNEISEFKFDKIDPKAFDKKVLVPSNPSQR